MSIEGIPKPSPFEAIQSLFFFHSVDAQASTLGCARLTSDGLGQLKTVATVTSAMSLLTLDLE